VIKITTLLIKRKLTKEKEPLKAAKKAILSPLSLKIAKESKSYSTRVG